MLLAREFPSQHASALEGPLQRRLGIAPRARLDQGQQSPHELRILLRAGFASAARAADALRARSAFGLRAPRSFELREARANAPAGQTGGPCHRGNAPMTQFERLTGRPEPARPFVEFRFQAPEFACDLFDDRNILHVGVCLTLRHRNHFVKLFFDNPYASRRSGEIVFPKRSSRKNMARPLARDDPL